MIIDFRADPLTLETVALIGGRVLVDGREIRDVWYADDKAGIVKTYDVMGDGKPHATRSRRAVKPTAIRRFFMRSDFAGREVECPIDRALSETLCGKVELIPRAKD